jgi:hypothetical protein
LLWRRHFKARRNYSNRNRDSDGNRQSAHESKSNDKDSQGKGNQSKGSQGKGGQYKGSKKRAAKPPFNARGNSAKTKRYEQKIDPDSPFAKLAALKEAMKGK